MVNGMNGGSHAAMAKWGLEKVDIPKEGEIVDLGCGGGGNVARLLRHRPGSVVIGVDYSPVSVQKSRKVNAQAIEAGHCDILEANVAALPFPDAKFRLATAFETIYFWPDIEKSFAEVLRVLEPGGRFLIVNEDDGLTGANKKWEKMIEGMHTYTPDEIKAHLDAAGFKDIEIVLDESRHWLAAVALK